MCQFRKVEQKIDTQKNWSHILLNIYSEWCQWSLSHSIYESLIRSKQLWMDGKFKWKQWNRGKKHQTNSTYAVLFSRSVVFMVASTLTCSNKTQHNSTQLKIHRSLLCMSRCYFSPPSHTSHTHSQSLVPNLLIGIENSLPNVILPHTPCLMCLCLCVFLWFVGGISCAFLVPMRFKYPVSYINNKNEWKRKRRRKRKNRIDTPIGPFELGYIRCNYMHSYASIRTLIKQLTCYFSHFLLCFVLITFIFVGSLKT